MLNKRTVLPLRPRTFTTAEALIERVRVEIFENGETFKAVALRTGVTASTVQRLANGKTKWPRPTTLFPLLSSLGLEMRLVKAARRDE